MFNFDAEFRQFVRNSVPINELHEQMDAGADQIMDMESFEEVNYDELKIMAAETGSDRELDFDWDRFVEREYQAFEKAILKGGNTPYQSQLMNSEAGVPM